MKVLVVAAALAVGVGDIAFAQPIEVPPGATSPSANTKDEGDKIVCRDEEKTGQRFKSRICHTKAQWAAMGEYGRSVTEATQTGSANRICPNGAC